VIKPEGSRLF